MTVPHDTLLLIARICLVLMFPFSAVDKVIHWKDAMVQANSSFLPGGAVLLLGGMVIETVMPTCIVLQWHAQPAALVLAAYCIVTALLFHPFWRKGDFWADGASVDRQHFWDFTKNFGLAGGMLLVATGAGLS